MVTVSSGAPDQLINLSFRVEEREKQKIYQMDEMILSKSKVGQVEFCKLIESCGLTCRL